MIVAVRTLEQFRLQRLIASSDAQHGAIPSKLVYKPRLSERMETVKKS